MGLLNKRRMREAEEASLDLIRRLTEKARNADKRPEGKTSESVSDMGTNTVATVVCEVLPQWTLDQKANALCRKGVQPIHLGDHATARALINAVVVRELRANFPDLPPRDRAVVFRNADRKAAAEAGEITMSFLRRLFRGPSSAELPGEPAAMTAARTTNEGVYYAQRGNLKRAIACFNRAIAIKEDHFPAHLGLATIAREAGDYERALQILDATPRKVSFLEPDSPAKQMFGVTGDSDVSFEIAFEKMSVLFDKHRREDPDGDLSDLVAALEEARTLGGQKVISEGERFSARAVGIDLDDDLRQKREMIEGLLAEIHKRTGA